MGNSMYSIDFVYTPSNSNEFKNVHIEFNLTGATARLTVSSKEEISLKDFSSLIDSVQAECFDKIKINLKKDCEIVLYIDEKTYLIIFNEETGEAIDKKLV